MKRINFLLLLLYVSSTGLAQTLNVPSGTIGISSNNNVGIGTPSPSDKLEVKGNTIRITDETNDSYWNRLVTNSDGSFSIKNPTGTNYFVIKNDKVGIGTNQPSDRLDVKGNTIRITDGANDSYWNRLVTNSDGSFSIKNPSGTNHFVIKNDKIAIGTNDFSGNHKLRVEGSIGAREIKVEATGWSDFVFENNYDLRTLEEVEQHINENGHLPEIPSEAEVKDNGINLGEMDAKLLRKIEELTLYVIEMNKQMKSQNERVEQLETQNAELKSKIQVLENQ